MSSRRITAREEKRVKEDGPSHRGDENLWAVLESRIQFKRCWSRRDKVARMMDAAVLAFVTLSLNRDENQGWQTTERNTERVYVRMKERERERERDGETSTRVECTGRTINRKGRRSKQQVKRRDGYRDRGRNDDIEGVENDERVIPWHPI